jgi:hypothetical protein
MSTKIRPIKCPNCGSEKHVQLGDKLYRCKSCGTEYFLDDDDITVHVKHHFDNGGFSSFNGNSNVSITSIAKVFAIIGVITFFLLFMIIYGLSSSSPSVSSRDSISVEDTYRAIVPVRYNGRVCFFYLTNRSFSNWYSDDETPPTGYYYGFIDPDSGKVLADKLFISDDDARKIGMTAFHMLEIQYLNQVKKWYITIPSQFILEINPQTLTLKNVTKTILAKKKAMSSGISSVNFISDTYEDHASTSGVGEGLKVVNNLAETYYYFPATDRLYTEDAYNYAKELPISELNGEVRDSVFYILERKDASENSSQTSQNKLWRIRFMYHLGDPQDAGYFLYSMENKRGDDRMISHNPITGWFTGFETLIDYQDAKYILIEYKTSISKDAPTVLQLRNTNGVILWTHSLELPMKIRGIMRDNQKIWFRATKENNSGDDEDYIASLTLKEGYLKYEYKFATNHKVPK